MTDTPDHPAQWSAAILDQLRVLLAVLPPDRRVFDPFAGVGLPALKAIRPDFQWTGYEIEPEWAAHDPDCIAGDSTATQFTTGTFHGVVTSAAYANRMADQYDGRDGSRRRTYRISLGRELSENSGAGMQWGDDYRNLHREVWRECHRVVAAGGFALVNVKDHVRKGRTRHVVDWHAETLSDVGFEVVAQVPVKVPGFRDGANSKARAEAEMILVCRR